MTVPFHPAGAWTAMVTPFTTAGCLDLEVYRRLVEFQIAQGIDGLVPSGTTGESPAFAWEEQICLIEETVRTAAGRVGVLAGTGSNCTAEAIKATRHAREVGVSAVLLVDCYYNGPSSLELREEYHGAVLDAVPEIPLVPYIIPGRSATALAAADLALLHLRDKARVPAVKEATGDLARMRADREAAGPALAILSGDDALTLEMMRDDKIAAAGVISVMSNLVPGAVKALVVAQSKGDTGKAAELNEVLRPLFSLVGCTVEETRTLPDGRTMRVTDKFRNPVPVKTMLAGLGLPVGACRRPLGKMSRPAVEKVREALRAVFKTAPELFTPLEKAFGINVERRLADDGAWAAVTR